MNGRTGGNERDAILERNVATMLAVWHRKRHVTTNFFPMLRRETTTIYRARMSHCAAAKFLDITPSPR